MISINIIEDFSQIKMTQMRHVNNLIVKIEEKNVLGIETEIKLNIEGCTTDYPATPKLIDYFLDHLSNQIGDKSLNIKLDGLGNKQVYILYILIFEGDFFGIKEKINSDEEVEKWKIIIDKKLIEKNIKLKVTYTPDNKIYEYGI